MVKAIEKLNSYSNPNKAAVVQRIESAPAAQGGYYTTFFGQEGLRADAKNNPDFTEKLREEVARIYPDVNILSKGEKNGTRLVVVHTDKPLPQVVEQYQAAAQQKLVQETRKVPLSERFELTKWRGILGNIGQFFVLLSGLGLNKYVAKFFDPAVDIKGKDKFSSSDKVISTVASVMGNGLNSWFGVQKKPDTERQHAVQSQVNDFLMGKGAYIYELPHSHDRLTAYTWQEKPRTQEQKTKVFFEQNAGVMSEVLKIVGKYSYFVGGKEKENDGDKMHGAISMAAKFVTVLGKDEDPYGLEGKQDWFNRLRQRSNLISGGMEWIANISQFAGAVAAKVSSVLRPDHTLSWSNAAQEDFKNNHLTSFNLVQDTDPKTGELKVTKKGDPIMHYTYKTNGDGHTAGDKVKGFALLGKDDKLTRKDLTKSSPSWQMVDFKNSYLMEWKKWDWLQLIGATFFTLSLTTKMMAPFTEKKVNVDELMAHNALGVLKLPQGAHAQNATEIVSHLLDMRAPSGIHMLPELHKMGFTQTFAAMADMLYTRHEVNLAEMPSEQTIAANSNEKSAPAPTVVPAVAERAPAESPEATPQEAPVATKSTLAGDIRDRKQEALKRGQSAFGEKIREESNEVALVNTP